MACTRVKLSLVHVFGTLCVCRATRAGFARAGDGKRGLVVTTARSSDMLSRSRFCPQGGAIETSMQSQGKAVAAAAGSMSLSPDALIELQRNTIAEHIKHEQVKDWPEVYRTFTPHAEGAYYDVVPFQTRFRKMQGVIDFYEAFTRGFPDFHIRPDWTDWQES